MVVRTDLTYGGRQYYRVMTYDGCGSLTDWFRLCAEYEGAEYGAGDRLQNPPDYYILTWCEKGENLCLRNAKTMRRHI